MSNNAQALRAFYLDKRNGAKRVAALPEGTSTGFLNPGARGRIPQAAIDLYNTRTKGEGYVEGDVLASLAQAKKDAAKVRKAAARKAARKGVTIGSRGPLPKAFAVTPKV